MKTKEKERKKELELEVISNQNRGKVQRFFLRYVFQAALFAIRSDKRRHGEDSRNIADLDQVD